MKYLHTLFVLAFMLNSLLAQENFQHQDRWLALFSYSNVGKEEVKKIAPHFPKTEVANEKSYREYTEKLAQWKKKYPQEVEAVLAHPSVKSLNPSRVHLGLQQAVEPRKFENSYWQWINAAGMTIEQVRTFAPHFPKPKITYDLVKSEEIYDAALQDWMKLFPKEHESILNNEVLITLKKNHEHVFIDTSTAEPFTLMEVSDKMPVQTDFDSGNPELDTHRYEMALKHWYFKFKPDEYLTRYNVAEYHKNLEEK